MYPKPALYQVKLESGLVIEDDMLPMDHCQVLPLLCASKWRRRWSTGASLWVYRHGNHGTRASRWWFCRQPSFHTNSSSVPSRPKHLWSDPVRHPEQSTVLMRCGLLRSPHPWTCLSQSSSGSMPPEDALDGSTSQTHETSNSTLPYAFIGKCRHFMPNTYRDWTGHYSNNNWE